MKHVLYSNYYGWISEEEIKQELIDCERVECKEEITDEMIWDERIPNITSLPIIHCLNRELKKGMLCRFPIKTNNAIKVKSK